MFHLIFFLLPKLILLIFLNEMNYVFPVKKKKKSTYLCRFTSFFSISSWQCCLSSFLDHFDSFLNKVGKSKGEVGQCIRARWVSISGPAHANDRLESQQSQK